MDPDAGLAAAAFRVMQGDPGSRVVIHVPHASTAIPAGVRADILLADTDLATELALMTDARTDEIAQLAADQSAVRPWLFVNQLSRLVIDPERFPDPADEVMAAPAIGMGAVYHRTADGRALRAPAPDRDEALLEAFFRPYAAALADVVQQRLLATGPIVIIDLQSFPLVELPYERHVHPDAPRPECCIGVDARHTPRWLIDAAAQSFDSLGACRVDEPFAGTYVPLAFYGTDLRVSSVMIELRRDTYLSDPGGVARVAAMLTRLLDTVEVPR
jgi:predicted N-formylglutamate amidohydrolase